MQLPATLCLGDTTHPLLALVESGAEESRILLDADVAGQLGLELIPLKTPFVASALDGSLLANVTHRTRPLTLVISGNHREQLSLHIISAPDSLLVLGYPWLGRHNPQFDWTQGKLASWSSICHAVCLRSAIPPAEAVPPPPESPDLSQVPREYHGLQEVFSKENALSLTPHRPYHCAINLLPDASLPSARLYNLSNPEREAMERYIRDSLAAGIIRPSSSPVGAGFFFVGKKDKSLRPCIDYRGLNQITVKNKYPLPPIDSAFQPLHTATIFTKLDLRKDYHLVRIHQGDE